MINIKTCPVNEKHAGCDNIAIVSPSTAKLKCPLWKGGGSLMLSFEITVPGKGDCKSHIPSNSNTPLPEALSKLDRLCPL